MLAEWVEQQLVMENNKAIAQVQQPLDNSLMMTIPGPKKPELQQPLNLKQVQRQVDHLIKRLPSNFNQLKVCQPHQIDNDTKPEQKQAIEQPKRQFLLSRYNYTGKTYRFEQAESLINITKPEVNQTSKTEVRLEKKKDDGYSMKNQNFSNLAEQSFDASQLKFPNHSYYILFDKHQQNKRLKSNIPPHTQSYFLQKKVKKLEEQMKCLKASETAQSFNVKKEGKMRLQKLLDSIIG